LSLLRFFFMLPPPPTSPLFPYTTLFRSGRGRGPIVRSRTARVVRRDARRDPGHRSRGSLSPRRAHESGTLASLGERTARTAAPRSEEHTSELQSLTNLVCRLLLEKKNKP